MKLGLTQRELAVWVGINFWTILTIENRRGYASLDKKALIEAIATDLAGCNRQQLELLQDYLKHEPKKSPANLIWAIDNIRKESA